MAALAHLLIHLARPRIVYDGRAVKVPADDLEIARRIIAKAEAAEGCELHPWCRAEVLKEETGWYSDEIYAAVCQLADEEKNSGH